jgi:septal ring factor EnvC (AmiA/AmiB activator)
MNLFPFVRMPGTCAALLAVGFAWLAWPASSAENDAAPSHAEVSEKRGDLKELRGRIESLRKEMSAAESERERAADRIKDVEREISATQRKLYGLSGQKTRMQTALARLGKQSQALTERLEELHAQLESLVYRQYLQGLPDALRLLLNGEEPNQMTRDLYYLGAVARARAQLLGETKTLLEQKQALSDNIRERAMSFLRSKPGRRNSTPNSSASAGSARKRWRKFHRKSRSSARRSATCSATRKRSRN